MTHKTLQILLAAFIALLSVCACSDDDEKSTTQTRGALPIVTVLYTPDGLGDGGYNDSICRGVYEAQKGDRFLVNSFSPDDYAEAEDFFKDWLNNYNKQTGVRQLLLLVGDDYEDFVRKYSDSIPDDDNYCVLLLESRASDLKAHTIFMPLYGASYETGLLASEQVKDKKALVMLANNYDEPLQDGLRGFCDGYQSATGMLPDTLALTTDSTGGYDLADATYLEGRYLAQDYDFIYPLIGGSIQGLLQYTRENSSNCFYLAGIDADMSDYSASVFISVVKHVNTIVQQQLSNWLNHVRLPRHQSFGYSSGMVEVVRSVDNFTHAFADIRDGIIQKEKNYEASKQ